MDEEKMLQWKQIIETCEESAIAYTLAESAKANDLNVYEYFGYLLEQMPNNDFALHPEVIDTLLPWSQELPDKCHLSQSKKMHLKK